MLFASVSLCVCVRECVCVCRWQSCDCRAWYQYCQSHAWHSGPLSFGCPRHSCNIRAGIFTTNSLAASIQILWLVTV